MKTFYLAFLLWAQSSRAQFFVAERETVPASIIILDQYKKLEPIGFDRWENKWDTQNPYTYIIALRDDQRRLFHILYQHGFDGRLTFFAYSKNLVPLFERADKPLHPFEKCLKNQSGFNVVFNEVDMVIECFMQRLAYCSD